MVKLIDKEIEENVIDNFLHVVLDAIRMIQSEIIGYEAL